MKTKSTFFIILSLFFACEVSTARTQPQMPALADRPVTARALLKNKQGAVLRDFSLPAVKRTDGGVAFTVNVKELTPEVADVEIRADIAQAMKGDPGYALCQRGNIITFKRDKMNFTLHRGWIYMPYFGMKTEHDTFLAVLEGMRFEHDLVLSAEKGRHEMFPRWRISEIGSPAYEDMTIVFYQLPLSADYNEMAKVYRSYKFSHDPAVRTMKERIPGNPNLAKLAASLPLRQTHASKPFNRKTDSIDFTPETEHPVKTIRTFDQTLALLKKLKEAGVSDVALCVAGWQTGGYDGRCPATFPVEPGPGGEAGIRRLAEGGRALGYLIDGHSNYTDCFSCSPLWKNGDSACMGPTGKRETNGAWSGGRAYNLCLKHAWETFLPADLEKIAKLGFHGCHYIDVFTAVQPYRCCDPKHPANKKEQAAVQLEIVKRCRKLFGGFASECCMDHLLGYVDYINYVCAHMRGKRQAEAKGRKSVFDRFVPFFELAFHDVVLSNPDKITQEVLSQEDNLTLVEFGGRPIFYSLSEQNFDGIVKAWNQFKTLRHLQLEEMVSHKVIAPGVIRVVYGNGEIILINRGTTPFTYGGQTVAPKNFKLVPVTAKSDSACASVLATNPSTFARKQETIEIPWDGAEIRVFDPQQKIFIPSQLIQTEKGKQLLFQSSFLPKEAKHFTLIPGKPQEPETKIVCASRHAPERMDDFFWENDKVANRIYGPTVSLPPPKGESLFSSGVDIWNKSTPNRIVDAWLKRGKYHQNFGEGMDNYKVSTGRGCGGWAIFSDGNWHTSKNWVTCKHLYDGPIRTAFEVTYAEWDCGNGKKIRETRRISIDAGSRFTKHESQFTLTGAGNVMAGPGLDISAKRQHNGMICVRPDEGWIANFEPEQKNAGHIATAIMLPSSATLATDPMDCLYLLKNLPKGRSFIWYAGSAWSCDGEHTSAASWAQAVSDYSQRVREPISALIE